MGGTKGKTYPLAHVENLLLVETGIESLVLAVESDTKETIKLLESNIGASRSNKRLNSDDIGLDLGRRLEVLLADLHDVLARSPEVDVDTQPRVESIAGPSHQSLCEFSLEHEHGDAGRVGHGQHLEDERTGNLVGRVGDEGVAWRHFGHLDDISQDDFELLGQGSALDTLGDFGTHTGIKFDGDDLLGLFEGADRDVTGTGTDFDDDIGGLEEGLVDNGIRDTGVLEDMLAKVLVELEDVGVGSLAAGPLAVVGVAAPGLLRCLRCLGHGGVVESMLSWVVVWRKVTRDRGRTRGWDGIVEAFVVSVDLCPGRGSIFKVQCTSPSKYHRLKRACACAGPWPTSFFEWIWWQKNDAPQKRGPDKISRRSPLS